MEDIPAGDEVPQFYNIFLNFLYVVSIFPRGSGKSNYRSTIF